ncbi:hypothetical protein PN471_10325 [Aphanizomenon sp. CS-733/32]|uniref:hypothetical protein n=1 Tax=Aphanizomenon sp. CS-733/32 TaxID=3021715 RepID=UPI00233087A3|nr:hypothetical protein [Aphanizomenon sp. CS-733/32]MDB9309027.1 hypothetical protein [Aphanizomenon sp. CS-733/32]
MAIYFIDSSALVKRYVNEIGSAWMLGLFDPSLKNEVFIAAITGVEIIAAITRRSRSRSISMTDAILKGYIAAEKADYKNSYFR